MPTRVFKVYETHTRVIDPIAEQLIYSVLRQLGILHYFRSDKNDAIFISSDRHAISGAQDQQGRVRVSNDRCDVEIDPILNPVSTRWDMIKSANMQAHWNMYQNKNLDVPLFSDSVADVQVVEVMVPAAIDLRFSLKFNTIDGATNALESIINQHLQQSVVVPHDIAYSYPVDMDIATFLMMVYQCRRFENPPGFIEYLMQNSTEQIDIDIHRYDVDKDQDKQRRQLVVRKRQLNTIGILEYVDPKPVVEKVESYPDNFAVNFTYYFQFARPSNLRATFPIMIENNLVPVEYAGTEDTSMIRGLDGRWQDRSFNQFFQTLTPVNPANTRIKFPWYDDFEPPRSPITVEKFNSFFIGGILLPVDPPAGHTERKIVVDLKDLAGYHLHPTTLEIMKLHRQEKQIFTTNGIYNITVFQNQSMIPATKMELSDDLILTVDVQDLSKRYHLVLSEATDVIRMQDRWLNVLMEHRCFFPSTVAANLQTLITRGVYKIVPSHALLTLLRRCLGSGSIDPLIRQLITDGHCSSSIWDYTWTAEQFAHYISVTRSFVSSCYLYEELVTLGLDAGCITSNNIPPRYVHCVIDAVGARQGGLNANTPLRIIDSTISGSD